MQTKYSRRLCICFQPIHHKIFDPEFEFFVISELILSLSVGISLQPIAVLDHTVGPYLTFNSPQVQA